ncbi:hypothetical protein M0813_29070 [Anaeramoeba flamelloides]|uniref:Uncharacterized protein n=1 Tax=Anaeramoeba flamelloides TaxID=1746091 RepID=A0ABQ8XQ94_9EUKA|nr:hypothetical protein M0813_29070 [Anaeramoeba flamelloides]
MRYFYLLLIPIFFLTYNDTYEHSQFLSSYFIPFFVLVYLQQLEEDKIVKRILYITLCGLTILCGYFFSLNKQVSSYQGILFNMVYYLIPAILQNMLFSKRKLRLHVGSQLIYPAVAVVVRSAVLFLLPKLKSSIACGYLQTKLPYLTQLNSVGSINIIYFFVPFVSCALYWVFGQMFYLSPKKKEEFQTFNSFPELFRRFLVICFVIAFILNLSYPRILFIRSEHKTSPLLDLASLSVSQLSEQYETFDETEEYLRTKYASELRELASIKDQFQEKVLNPYNEKLINLTNSLPMATNTKLIMWSESNGIVISKANEKKLIKKLKKSSINSNIHILASYSVFKRDPSGNRSKTYNNRIVVIDNKGEIILQNEKKNPVNELEKQSQWISKADNQYFFNLKINNISISMAVMYFDDLMDYYYKSDLIFSSKFANNLNSVNGNKAFPDLLLLPMSNFVPKSNLDKLLRTMAVQNGMNIFVQPRNDHSLAYSSEGILLKSQKLPSDDYGTFISHSSFPVKSVPSILMKIEWSKNIFTFISLIYFIVMCILYFIYSKKKKIVATKKDK